MSPAPCQDEQISREVSAWVQQVRHLLEQVNGTLDIMELKEPATLAERQMVKKLPGLIRQRLAGVPTPEMIQTWVRVLARSAPAAASHHRAKHK